MNWTAPMYFAWAGVSLASLVITLAIPDRSKFKRGEVTLPMPLPPGSEQ